MDPNMMAQFQMAMSGALGPEEQAHAMRAMQETQQRMMSDPRFQQMMMNPMMMNPMMMNPMMMCNPMMQPGNTQSYSNTVTIRSGEYSMTKDDDDEYFQEEEEEEDYDDDDEIIHPARRQPQQRQMKPQQTDLRRRRPPLSREAGRPSGSSERTANPQPAQSRPEKPKPREMTVIHVHSKCDRHCAKCGKKLPMYTSSSKEVYAKVCSQCKPNYDRKCTVCQKNLYDSYVCKNRSAGQLCPGCSKARHKCICCGYNPGY